MWQANLQAIQNLMGFVYVSLASLGITLITGISLSSDVDDAILPLIPHLTYQTPYTSLLLTASIITLLLSIPLVYLIPFRVAVLFIGLLPFFFTHPFTRTSLLPAISSIVISPFWKAGFSWFYRVLDDDRLDDKHWRAELRQVEVFENERWNPNSREASSSSTLSVSGSGFLGPQDNAGGLKHYQTGWGKSNLKSGERKAWTRGRDGWSGIADSGDVRSVFHSPTQILVGVTSSLAVV